MSASPAPRVPADEPETAVLERARAGDHGAFVTLVRRHDAGLRRLAYRLLGDRERMDDALQEAYLRAFRALPGFRGDAAFVTWIYRITYTACVEELQRSQRLHAVPLDEGTEQAAREPDLAEDLSVRAALVDALAALPPEDRATVLLVDAQGFDYREAGAALGVPEGTIASRLHRARRVLRRALAGRVEGVTE